MKDYGTDNQLVIKRRYNKVVFSAICLSPDERKKDRNDFTFIETGNQRKPGLFVVYLSGRMSFGAFFGAKNKKNPSVHLGQKYSVKSESLTAAKRKRAESLFHSVTSQSHIHRHRE